MLRKILQRDRRQAVGAHGLQTRRHGLGTRKRGDLRDAVLDRLGSKLVAIIAGGMPERRVDHERDIAGDQHVEHVGRPFADLLDRSTVYTGSPQRTRGALGCHDTEAKAHEIARDRHDAALVAIAHAHEHRPPLRGACS